ncbi:MAG: GHMP kinase, partial [Candidatus Bathyarchaeota archaeon]
MKEAKAFSPGHITGFFQICDQQEDPLQIGSRGAGVSIARGTATRVRVENSAKTSVKIMINGEVTDSASVSEHVANAFLSLNGEHSKVLVEHDVELPIGCGYGSSGAGAISLAFALNEAFNNRLSRLEAAQLAHVAEVECGTGLGTVVAEAAGGLEIRARSGAPGVGEMQSIPISEDYVAACLSFGPLSTSRILKDES